MYRKWNTQQCAENSTETKIVLVLPTPHRRSKNNPVYSFGFLSKPFFQLISKIILKRIVQKDITKVEKRTLVNVLATAAVFSPPPRMVDWEPRILFSSGRLKGKAEITYFYWQVSRNSWSYTREFWTRVATGSVDYLSTHPEVRRLLNGMMRLRMDQITGSRWEVKPSRCLCVIFCEHTCRSLAVLY